MFQGFFKGKLHTTIHLLPVEPLEGWQNLLAKFHGIAPPVVWKILIKKTCTVKILKYFFSLDGSLKIEVLTKYYENLTNQYRGEEKGKRKHHCLKIIYFHLGGCQKVF